MQIVKDILEWCLNNTGFLGFIIAIISLLVAYSGIKQWKVDKMINMHYRFKEERKNILKNIEDSNPNDENIFFLDLLNELELISLLHQKRYLEDKLAKEMFNTWIQNIYSSEDMQTLICQERSIDPQAYENLEKTYKAWNKKVKK